MRHKHITIRLFAVTTVFLFLFVIGMIVLQSYYFGTFYEKQKTAEFQLAFQNVLAELDGINISESGLMGIFKYYQNENNLTTALFPEDVFDTTDIGESKKISFKPIIAENPNDAITIFSKLLNDSSNIELLDITSLRIIEHNEFQYIMTFSPLTVNNTPYIMGAFMSLKSLDEAVSAMDSASWLVYIIAVISSLLLSVIISKLIARPLIREIEHEKQLDNMRREFIANASHELKTPISIISGHAESLIDGILSQDERAEYERTIYEETRYMGDLVRDLLEISMLQNEKLKLYKTEIDIARIANRAVHRLSCKISEKGINLSLDAINSVVVFADEALLESVLINLLSNAISHTGTGGTIRIGIVVENKTVRFEIENTGKSIPEEQLNNIWDSFFRADKAHNREEGRYGLGLSIVKSIVEKHKGKVGVCNTATGVMFYFELYLK